ncbi:hypothetical protein TMUPMC115_0261 [Tetragenococcus muriaticus PMC-11-5]|uniref:BppU N-terminal domain-containing protein n=1 Tax=Tetragenococcus muriaticus PMC-11-5 TaxID=1302649 RepID=A0A091CFU3_9ENTE|nr:BppU family phage baseplate upper protein [Tetragenococcus muriaticus]KFN93663.1 hypothetical protein TMUPMC115_0261 [Tetragenococcus muriaticus PMC-11-5]
MSENQNKLYKDIVLEVDIDAKKGSKNQGKETKATFYSYDIDSGMVKINIEKDGQPLPLSKGTKVLINVVKLGLPQQKLVYNADIVDATKGITHWDIPEYLTGYKGKVRAGVFINLPNGQRLHGGYFKFNMGISEIDTNLEEFEEDYWQGWDEFQKEAEAEWSDWEAIRDDTWKKQEEDYDKWKKDQEEKQASFENDYAEHWDNWKTQQRNKQNEFEKDYDTWKSTQESKQSDFENDFSNWKTTQEKKQTDFESDTNKTISGINTKVDTAQSKVIDLEKNLDVEQKNYFSVKAWEEQANTDVITNDFPTIKIELEGNTKYTLSTNIPKSGNNDDVFFTTGDKGTVNTPSDGVSAGNPRTITTNDDGVAIVAIRDKDMTSGDWWVMLNKGSTAYDWTPNTDDLATKQETDKKFADKADKTDLAGKVGYAEREFIIPEKTFENLHQEDTESNRSTWLQIVLQGSIGYLFGTVKSTVDLEAGFTSTVCTLPNKYKILTTLTTSFVGDFGKSGTLKIINSEDYKNPNEVQIYRFKDVDGTIPAPTGERFDLFGVFLIDPK